MKKICYFTSKDSDDIRVYHKECVSLASNGYDVTLVCPNSSNYTENGVHIVGVEYKHKSELARFFILPRLLYNKAIEVDADIYHFNDPASLYYGSLLKKKGKKVVFDSFEDHPSLWMNRSKGIKGLICKFIGRLYGIYELKKCSRFDAVITCYHWTMDRLSKVNNNVVLVLNFPIVSQEELLKKIEIRDKDVCDICYAGLISKSWNIDTIIDAIEGTDISFNLAGWGDENLISDMKGKKGWKNVNFFGRITKEEVFNRVYTISGIGIALYHYSPLCKWKVGNLSNNKLFEYMLEGMPVVCTDFDLWKEVVENNKCGICVNPSDKNAIRDAILSIRNNKDEARQMGENGRRIVIEHYNWKTQEDILLRVYNNL